MFGAIAFKFPASLSASNTAVAGQLANAAAQLTAAKNRLTAAPAISVTNNPVAAACAGSEAVLAALHSTMQTDIKCVCVHPWTQGVGQGERYNRYLSPANAVAAAAKKFTDSVDAQKPQASVDTVCVLLSATSYAQLATTLQQFCTVFPDAQLQLCMRRAKQLSTVERDKTLLSDAAGNAVWRPGRVLAVGRTLAMAGALGERVAHAAAYERGGVNAQDELIALANKKTAQLNAVSAAVTALAASFSGGTGRGVFIAAKTPEQTRNQLLSNTLGHDEPLACCVLYSGVPGRMNLLREVLGL